MLYNIIATLVDPLLYDVAKCMWNAIAGCPGEGRGTLTSLPPWHSAPQLYGGQM